MGNLRTILGIFLSAACFAGLCGSVPAARGDAADPRVLQSLVRIEAMTPQGPRAATGCVVTDEGLVATCIDAVENATQVHVVFATGDTVVLYSALPNVRRVNAMGLPGAGPLLASEGAVLRVYSGEEKGCGLFPPPRIRPDSDTYCFNVAPRSTAGIAGVERKASSDYLRFKWNPNGPDSAGVGWGVVITDARGSLIGMLVPPSIEGERGWPAVHAIHLRALLPQRKPAVRSLRLRKTFEEPTPLEASPQPTGSRLVTGAAQRGLPPAEIVQAIGERLAQLARQRAAIEDDLAYLASLIQETNLVGIELNRLARDEKRTVTETSKVKIKDKNGNYTTETEKEDVSYYSYSQAIRARRAELANRLTKLGSNAGQLWTANDESKDSKFQDAHPSSVEFHFELQVLNHWRQIGLPAESQRIQRVERETASELYYRFALDVCSSEPELQKFDAAMSELLRSGGNSGTLYLARGVLRIRLGDFNSATKDLKQAVVVDASLEGAVLGVQGWLETRRGDASRAKTIARAVRAAKQDPQVTVMEALCALEDRDMPRFQQLLKQALDAGGDPAEIHRVLGLYCATGVHAAKNALSHAQRACAATQWSDWRMLLVLAAAQASDSHFPEAQATVVRAARAAPAGYRGKCREWHDAFAAKEQIKLEWK